LRGTNKQKEWYKHTMLVPNESNPFSVDGMDSSSALDTIAGCRVDNGPFPPAPGGEVGDGTRTNRALEDPLDRNAGPASECPGAPLLGATAAETCGRKDSLVIHWPGPRVTRGSTTTADSNQARAPWTGGHS